MVQKSGVVAPGALRRAGRMGRVPPPQGWPVTCEHTSEVMAIPECPKRSDTTFIGTSLKRDRGMTIAQRVELHDGQSGVLCLGREHLSKALGMVGLAILTEVHESVILPMCAKGE